MDILGKVKDGVVVLNDARALPDGTVVRVEPVEEGEACRPAGKASEAEGATLAERLHGLAGIAKGLPPDLARNHDHYLHGRPKK